MIIRSETLYDSFISNNYIPRRDKLQPYKTSYTSYSLNIRKVLCTWLITRLPHFNPIMPALCWHNKTTYYAQSNASILCLSLVLVMSAKTTDSLLICVPDLDQEDTRALPRTLCSHCSVVAMLLQSCCYDLTTLSYTALEHAQSHQHMPVEWVWSINHRHTEQKMHDL